MQVLFAVVWEEREVIEELHVHFSVIAKVLIAVEVDLALKDQKSSTGGIFYEGELDCQMQVHPNCPETGILIAIDALKKEIVLDFWFFEGVSLS